MPLGGDQLTSFQTARRNLVWMSTIAVSAIIGAASLAVQDGSGDTAGKEGSHGHGFRCFLKGTKIRTRHGQRKIEELAAGDVLPTVFGGVRRIRWVGRDQFTRSDRSRAWAKDVLPVRIARSALAPDIPQADLFVTETHALLIDGVLVAAGNLINGTTITRHGAHELDRLEYFHIKLERHDVIYAEGAPCETLLNVDENAATVPESLRGYGSPITLEPPCAPLFQYGYRRGEIKSYFRSAISPWFDYRQPSDIIRDKLDVRGIALLGQSELMG